MITGRSNASDRAAGRKRYVRWCLIVGALIALLFGVATILLVLKWPFTRQAVTVALQDRFAEDGRNPQFPQHLLSAGLYSRRYQFPAAEAQGSSTADHGSDADYPGQLRGHVQCS